MHVSYNHHSDCEAAFCAETYSTPEYKVQVDDTKRQLWDTGQGR